MFPKVTDLEIVCAFPSVTTTFVPVFTVVVPELVDTVVFPAVPCIVCAAVASLLIDVIADVTRDFVAPLPRYFRVAPFSQTSPSARLLGSLPDETMLRPAVVEDEVNVCFWPAPKVLAISVNTVVVGRSDSKNLATVDMAFFGMPAASAEYTTMLLVITNNTASKIKFLFFTILVKDLRKHILL